MCLFCMLILCLCCGRGFRSISREMSLLPSSIPKTTMCIVQQEPEDDKFHTGPDQAAEILPFRTL